MSSRLRALAVAGAIAALFTPMRETISAQTGTFPSLPGLMISEFRFSAGNTLPNEEFVELFNSTPNSMTIGGLWLHASNNTNPPGISFRAQIPALTELPSGFCYLIANSASSLAAKADLTYGTGIAEDGSVGLSFANPVNATQNRTSTFEQVGFATASPVAAFTFFFETTRIPIPTNMPLGRVYERVPDLKFFFGYQDTNNNANDFVEKGRGATYAGNPTNLKDGKACLDFKAYTAHEIQGSGRLSPLSGALRVQGVVTARRDDGFFIQTEPGQEDNDPRTSEGLFVEATGAQLAAAVVGRLVKVTGAVKEFVPATDAGGASVTRIGNVISVQNLGDSTVPLAHALTLADLTAGGGPDQLERFEGMLVTADLTAVSGSDNDAAFFAVLKDQPRPFREPGVRAGAPAVPCAAIDSCNVPVFDGNPEVLRVDANGLRGVLAPVDPVSTGAQMTGVTGALDFAARAYTLLPTATLVHSGGMAIVGAAPASADQYTVATMKLGAADETGLAKASKVVRTVMGSPDVIGVQGVSTLGDLHALAAKVNADAAGAVEYLALPNGDPTGVIGIGVLVRANRVSSPDVEQLASDDFDHAPLVLRATLNGPSTRLPQELTVVVSEFASRANVESDAGARAKRQVQSEFLADYVKGLQINNAGAFVVLGGFNAFEFNDGYVDVVGAVRGAPAAAEQLTNASADVVSPDLLDLDESSPAERYTSIANGSAQSLDHVLASADLESQFVGVVHARVNADFAHSFGTDASTPKRQSDTDPMVAYFVFPPDVDAPVFSFTPANQVVEATGPSGAVATYAIPTADDNLDASVEVECAPASGSTFPLGNNAVACFTQDLAGNTETVEFTVTVEDTTPPSVTVPSDRVAEATSPGGAAVTFDASAGDLVTLSLSVTCTPSSGSTFGLGLTEVTCSSTDDSGNAGSSSFKVTVVDTTAPSLTVPGDLTVEATAASGAAVSFETSASDAASASLSVTCTPASGSTFGFGKTQVNCSVDDAAGNHKAASFQVTVVDTTAPSLRVPDAVTAEATSALGAVVSFTASATDSVTASPTITCLPASGSTFGLGNTTVTCTARDASGNSKSAQFAVTVRDTTPPALFLPSPINADAVTSAGRSITFAAWATDAVTVSPSVTCTPASGSTFPIGDTTVGCVAKDEAGNATNGSFLVTIAPPAATVDGRMSGAGEVVAGSQRTWFMFAVRKSATSETGGAMLMTRDGNGRPDRFVALSVSNIRLEGDGVSFTAVGSWNGAWGYRVEITALDNGEPGRDRDTFSMTLYAPNGAVVKSATGTLRDGNIQARF